MKKPQPPKGISIHAPRGGSDGSWKKNITAKKNFNPRSPWGERLDTSFGNFPIMVISIHAPRGGSDPYVPSFPVALQDFNPRSPWGERL